MNGFLRRITVMAALVPALVWADAQTEDVVFKSQIVPLLDTYCYRCHGKEKQKGDMRLDGFTAAGMILPARKHWLKVLEQLESREMPSKKPLPTELEYETLIRYIDKAVNDIDWTKIKEPGHVTIPLLTKAEYYNTLEALLGLDLRNGSTFSEDGEGESGFTNDRDGLFVSTTQMEKYLQTAEAAIDALIAIGGKPGRQHLESEDMFMTETRENKQTIGDLHGYVLNRGQMTLYDSVAIPVDGTYRISVRGLAPGAAPAAATAIRADNQLLATLEFPGKTPEVRSVDAFLAKGSRQLTLNIAAIAHPLQAQPPARTVDPTAIAAIPATAGKNAMTVEPRVRSAAEAADVDLKLIDQHILAYQTAIETLRVYVDSRQEKQISAASSAAAKSKQALVAALKALGENLKMPVVSGFQKRNAQRFADNDAVFNSTRAFRQPDKLTPVAIDWIEIEGPLPPAGWIGDSVFIQHPGETVPARAAATAILRTFLPRAFRHPVSDDEVARYLALFEKGQRRGDSFVDSMKLALTGVLVSPSFLFRDELKPSTTAYALDDYQLASRLSYFIWMSMPDDTLFALAAKGELHKPEVLQAQLQRLIMDPRARRFVSAFAGEWLGFKTLGDSVRPDDKKFPDYTASVNEAGKLEVVLLLEQLFREDGNLLDLLDAPYTYLNDELARHYRIPGVEGPEMRRVALTDRTRGGLLGTAAILASTSNPGRTSPVLRGKWVLETLLGEHAGNPPADAGALPGNAGSKPGKTLREEFSEHRRDPSCAACHNKIDPIGFGLENFDAIGRFRTKENGKAIDASGELPDGSTFNGPVELKNYLLTHRQEDFVRNVVERLLSFALGRQLHYFDEPAIRSIIAATAKDGYRSRTLLVEVVRSYPFTHQSNNTDIVGAGE